MHIEEAVAEQLILEKFEIPAVTVRCVTSGRSVSGDVGASSIWRTEDAAP